MALRGIDTEAGRGLVSRIMVSDTASSSNAVSALFEDLQKKGLISGGGSS